MAERSTLNRRLSEFFGVVLFAAALVWLISLLTYDADDPMWFFNVGATHPARNFIGRVGAFLSELSFQVLGYGSYVIPFVLGVLGWNRFWCRELDAVCTKAIGATLGIGCITSFLSLALGSVTIDGKQFRAGGYAGAWLSGWLSEYLNRTGSIIVIVTALFLALILSTQFSFGRLFSAIAGWLGTRARALQDSFMTWRQERRKEKQRREVIKKHTNKAKTRPAEPPAVAAVEPKVERPAPLPAVAAMAAAGAVGAPVRREVAGPIAPPLPLGEPEALVPRPAQRRGAFSMPPAALLDPPRGERKIDEHSLMERARQLEEKCREFSVAGAVLQIHPGPVVTTFEFKPEAGIKYSKITGLADDLCLAMKAESVLIERIPGKSTVGIQIPNEGMETISLRELLDSDAYKHSGSKLSLALGKTIHGEPFVADLAAMPHLLIAGATGTGKSVSLNAMLTSILYRATPDDVRLILIDPKRLELGVYEEIPHLLTPVVTDPKAAANALKWAVREMEERYKVLAGEGVRNIEQFNRNVREEQKTTRGSDMREELGPLPYVVVVIDELADLMMVSSTEVEESIARLAQMARAVGIHLILATQRPSVDVITGLIKANLPARISFRVSSRVDSRTILDGNGAEQLLGRGDMLYLPPASARLIRLHGAYVSEQEGARLAGFLRKQGKPVYDDTITAEEKRPDEMEFEKDDLYDEAARLVVSTGQASISYLQRRLRIGFSRAARLIDMMETEGLVSPSAGGKPREVLVDKSYFDEVDNRLE